MRFGGVLYTLGWLLAGLTVLMFAPAITGLLSGDFDNALVFFNAGVLTTFFAGAMVFALRGAEQPLNTRNGLFLIVLMWVVLPLFAAIPLYFSGVVATPGQALFESVSGLTTTGATVLAHLDRQPAAILIWRAILQWLGGLYTVVSVTAILAALGIGGMQLQYATLPHGEGQTLFGRLRQTGSVLLSVYSLLTFMCFVALWLAGLPLFDALCHALSTVSTGGFSTRDGSLGAFNAPWAELAAMIFMVLGAMNITLHWSAVNGRWRHYRHDPEVRYLGMVLVLVVIGVTLALVVSKDDFSAADFRWALFNSVSFATNTGLWTGELADTPNLPALLLLGALAIGGASGSTTGGIKLMRIGLVFKQGWLEVAQLLYPNQILRLRYGKIPVNESQIAEVWAVFVLYCLLAATVILLFSLTGPDLEQSVALALASLSNCGPPVAMFFSGQLNPVPGLPESSQAISIIAMLMGRMGVLTALTLLNPAFWRG